MGLHPTSPRMRKIEAIRRRHGAELVDRLIPTIWASDEPADRLVETFRAMPGGQGWALLDRALAGPGEVPDLPPELAVFLAPALEPPAWVDFDLIDAGAAAWWRVGPAARALALIAGSLAFGYQSASLSRPLAATGRLTQMAPRRLGETTRWVIEISRPGALRPGAEGLRATVRLRAVHALVRAHLRRDWDVASWGEPISIGDTIATGLGGFLLVPERALADLGVRQTAAEMEALFAMWRWITFLMGVPEEHLPATLPEAREWVEIALAIDEGPDESSAGLMHALLFHGVAFERGLPGPAAAAARLATAHVLGGFTRRWMGDEMADRLEVPDTPVKHLAPLLRPLSAAREVVLASRLLGPDERVLRLEGMLLHRLLTAAGTVPAALAPEAVEAEPALRPAA